jgi:hypothetical protein
MSRIVDLVENPLIAHADTEKPFVASHRLHTVRPRVLGESEEMRIEALSHCKGKLDEFALG